MFGRRAYANASPFSRSRGFADKDKSPKLITHSSFLNVYLWFVDAGKAIPFTVAMWLVFMILILVHGNVLETYRVKQGVANTIRGVSAHPLLGNTPEIAMTQDTVVPVHCDCNCLPRDLARQMQMVRACTVQKTSSASWESKKAVTLSRQKGVISGQTFTDFLMQDMRKEMFATKQRD